MEIISNDIENITRNIWSSMLGLDLERNSGIITNLAPELVGYSTLTGNFHCIVSLHISQTFARRSASIMYSIELEEIYDEQVKDAVAELTNMIGGNIKSLLCPDSKLSLPKVTTPTAFLEQHKDITLSSQIAFSDHSGDLIVSVYH